MNSLQILENDTQLAQMMTGVDEYVTLQAEANLNALLAQTPGSHFTIPEKRAMLLGEELKLVGDFDLVAILMRGKRIANIESEGLERVHPNQYGTVEAMANDMGISKSLFSDTRSLYEVIFPYVVDVLGLNLVVLWEDIGISRFRDLIPYLRPIIEGTGGTNVRIQERVAQLLQAAAEGLGITLEEGENAEIPADVIQAAVADLLDNGAQLPVREMRRMLRNGGTTPSIDVAILNFDGRYYWIAEADDDQLTL
ncbi:MAG: hypothetical protein JXB38_05745, partial [Anaerolineales bacterium]|nr:hypothetical protein [Anaerolineales bacterium]